MSATSSTVNCPNCGYDGMETYKDYKPYDHHIFFCANCGWEAVTEDRYLSLEELNNERAKRDLPLLKELPTRKGILTSTKIEYKDKN